MVIQNRISFVALHVKFVVTAVKREPKIEHRIHMRRESRNEPSIDVR